MGPLGSTPQPSFPESALGGPTPPNKRIRPQVVRYDSALSGPNDRVIAGPGFPALLISKSTPVTAGARCRSRLRTTVRGKSVRDREHVKDHLPYQRASQDASGVPGWFTFYPCSFRMNSCRMKLSEIWQNLNAGLVAASYVAANFGNESSLDLWKDGPAGIGLFMGLGIGGKMVQRSFDRRSELKYGKRGDRGISTGPEEP